MTDAQLHPADAVKLRAGANEEVALRDGNTGAQVAFAGIGHPDRVEELELGSGSNHEHIAGVAHHVNLAIAGGGGGFDLGFAVEWRVPDDLAGGFHASQAALVAVQDVESALVEQWRGNVRTDVSLRAFPGDRAVIKVALPAQFDCINGRAFRAACQCDTAPCDGRWHQPPVADLLRIPCAPAPEFLAGGRIVPGDAIPAGHQDLGAPAVDDGHRRGECLERFLPSVSRPDLFPKLLPSRRIEGQKVGIVRAVLASTAADRRVALEDLNVELAV